MKHHLFLPTVLLAMASFAGCSSVAEKNTSLDDARTDFRAAQNNPQVVQHAPGELKQAGDALAKANNAASQRDDAEVVTHLAYLAKQRTAIAQETARQKQAESAVVGASAERNKIRLDARTEEANQAKLNATAAQRQAETARQQARMARHESEMSQQQTRDAEIQAETARQQAKMAQHESEMSQQQKRDAEMRNSQLEAQVRELNELNAKKTERGLVITLGDVLFDTNQSQLKPRGTRSLQKLAAFLKRYPLRKAQVEGHTDNTGAADYNQALSDRRANAVRTSLVGMGIDNERIATHGFGQASPIASNDTASGRQSNRRVEIILSDENKDVSAR